MAKGDLNKSTFVGEVLGTAIPFRTDAKQTPGCSFVLKVQEDKDGPTNELPMVIHGKMAVSIYPKLIPGQRVVIQAAARFKKPSVVGAASQAPFFIVQEIVTLPHAD